MVNKLISAIGEIYHKVSVRWAEKIIRDEEEYVDNELINNGFSSWELAGMSMSEKQGYLDGVHFHQH